MEPTHYTDEESFGPDHLQRAMLLIQQGRSEEARDALLQVLAEDPEHDYAHALMAISLLGMDEDSEALASVRKAIGLSPDVSYYHSIMALILVHNKKSKEALVSAQEGVKLDPDSAYAYGVEAKIYFQLSRWKEANESAERGLAIDSEDVELTNIRSMALTKLGLRDEASAAIDTALRNQPDNSRTHANKGWNLLHDGQYKEAMESFREALRLDPNNEWARQGIIESIKADTVIYRPILKTFLWLTTLPPNTLFFLVIGFFVLGRFLGPLESNNPEYAGAIGIFRIMYIGIIYLSWTANTMFNLVLFAHPIGKHALSRVQKQASAIVGVLLILGLGSIVWMFAATPGDVAVNMAWISFGLVIPVSGLEHLSESKWRNFHLFFCCAMGVVGSGAVLSPAPFDDLFLLMFVFALVAYSWVTSLGSFASRR